MQSFQMLRPRSMDEALALLAQHGPSAQVYAGGQDLLYRFKRRVSTNPPVLVNVKQIDGLRGIAPTDDGGLRIGALTTLGTLERSALVRDRFPVLHGAAAEIASPQIRNLGTVGGNLCQDVWCWYLLADYDCWLNGGKYCYAAVGEHRYYHSAFAGQHCVAAHPSDLAPALVALDATCTIASAAGTRTVPVDTLWPGFQWIDGRLRSHALRAGEILTEVQVPPPAAGQRGVFRKYRLRNSWDFALASVAAVVRLDGDQCTAARVVLGGLATQPIRAAAAEGALVGSRLDDATIARAAEQAAAGARPLRLNRYKLSLLKGLCRQTLRALRDEPRPTG
jgi:xanthine dehydrogenase YagS FAD-binding subunit